MSEDVFSEALGRAVVQWPGAKLLDHGCAESSILGKLLYQLLPLFSGWLSPNPSPSSWETSRKELSPGILC